MLNKIHMVNFKSFVNASLELKPLTVLTGLNNSGKSSVIQAINMIRDYCKGDNKNTGHVSPRFLKSKLSKDNFFEVSLETNTKLIYHLKIIIDGTSFSAIMDDTNNPMLDVQYISADRFGPRNVLELTPESQHPEIGTKGEYIIDYIEKNSAMKINPILARSGDELDEILLLKENINAWLQYISPGTELSYEINLEQNSSYPYYNKIHPTETGYGLSYILPVITALLASAQPTDSLLLIENPEAHLHPKGQTAMGELIALSASTGKQIIVETHSDHLLDGIRIAVKRKKISNANAVFHYFSRNNYESETKIETPILGEDGKLSFWPKGFFDQSMINKAELLKNGE